MAAGDTVKIIKTRVENLVVNGALDNWQRGTDFNPLSSGSYCVDRFRYSKSGSGAGALRVVKAVGLAQRPSIAESNYSFDQSMRLECLTAATGTDRMLMIHPIEGNVLKRVIGQDLVLSFWAWTHTAGTYCISLRNYGPDMSFVAEYELEAQTWKRVVIIVPKIPYQTGLWYFDKNCGLYVSIYMANLDPSTQTATVGEWQSGNYECSANQANAMSAPGDAMYVTGFMLASGNSELPFQTHGMNPAEETLACKRYYEKREFYISGWGQTGVGSRTPMPFVAQMRDIPSMNHTNVGYSNIASYAWYDVGTTQVTAYWLVSSTGGATWHGYFTASAEI